MKKIQVCVLGLIGNCLTFGQSIESKVSLFNHEERGAIVSLVFQEKNKQPTGVVYAQLNWGCGSEEFCSSGSMETKVDALTLRPTGKQNEYEIVLNNTQSIGLVARTGHFTGLTKYAFWRSSSGSYVYKLNKGCEFKSNEYVNDSEYENEYHVIFNKRIYSTEYFLNCQK